MRRAQGQTRIIQLRRRMFHMSVPWPTITSNQEAETGRAAQGDSDTVMNASATNLSADKAYNQESAREAERGPLLLEISHDGGDVGEESSPECVNKPMKEAQKDISVDTIVLGVGGKGFLIKDLWSQGGLETGVYRRVLGR